MPLLPTFFRESKSDSPTTGRPPRRRSQPQPKPRTRWLTLGPRLRVAAGEQGYVIKTGSTRGGVRHSPPPLREIGGASAPPHSTTLNPQSLDVRGDGGSPPWEPAPLLTPIGTPVPREPLRRGAPHQSHHCSPGARDRQQDPPASRPNRPRGTPAHQRPRQGWTAWRTPAQTPSSTPHRTRTPTGAPAARNQPTIDTHEPQPRARPPMHPPGRRNHTKRHSQPPKPDTERRVMPRHPAEPKHPGRHHKRTGARHPAPSPTQQQHSYQASSPRPPPRNSPRAPHAAAIGPPRGAPGPVPMGATDPRARPARHPTPSATPEPPRTRGPPNQPPRPIGRAPKPPTTLSDGADQGSPERSV
ncbi:PREDICTED: extensin-like [Cyprinodon variegatus]|uniref:extensin-like n=1 Tax=Cyprinodon variegatus TaxID=28743 RepID=UPI0007428B88|nr:PREDICTED: extensin-like [Cyprinodon variegatus]